VIWRIVTVGERVKGRKKSAVKKEEKGRERFCAGTGK